MNLPLILITLLPLAAPLAGDSRGLADALILHPPPAARWDFAATETWRTIRVADGVEVCVLRSPAAVRAGRVDAYVLEFTGNGNAAQQVVRWVAEGIWKDRAVEVWAVNYPGYGRSAGRAKLSSIGPAALSAYDALRASAGEGAPIFSSGASLGGMTALFVASRRPVEGVLVLNPPALREVVQHHGRAIGNEMLAAKVAAMIPTELDAIANAAMAAAPLFAVVSGRDEVVPAVVQEQIFARYAGPKTVIRLPHATHGRGFTAEVEAAKQRWIEEQWRRLFQEK